MAVRLGACVWPLAIRITSAVPSPGESLHEAEPVAARNKAERFGIDGNRPLVAGGVFN